ncbi:AAA family ATPase [Patescibacteria group bacterium]|nr:AAA family ATPase [Patescibacteria group bacterium]
MTSVIDQISIFSKDVKNADLPEDLKSKILVRLEQLSNLTKSPTFLPEFDRINRYIEWVLALPWNKRTKDILDLEHTRSILDKHHYGLGEIKDRILEYMSIMNLKQVEGDSGVVMRAPILCFVGLVGTGKTTIAISIAQAMGRNFARIPFGGMGDPLDLRGQSRMHAEAEPGKVIKALKYTQSKNCVILLDEIDRVTDDGRSSIMGVLVELLDPEQNSKFIDHYLDFPIDLSEVLFIATANNTRNISTAVLDRLEPIQMPSYSDQEKITIGQKYMLPKIIKRSGIPLDSFVIEDDAWALITRPLGFDAGMRTLERTIEGIVRKVAKSIVEGKGDKFEITTKNIREFLPH